MQDKIDVFIKNNKSIFEAYKKHIELEDWSLKEEISLDNKGKKTATQVQFEKFLNQKDLVQFILGRVKTFIDITQKKHSQKRVRDFIDFCLSIVDLHKERLNNTITSTATEQLKGKKLSPLTIKMLKECQVDLVKIDDKLATFNIEDEQATEELQWLDKQKATIAMHEVLSRQYPEINIKLKNKGIDLDSPPPSTIHITNPNPPIYDSTKNYWDQDSDVLQYYFDEYKKIRDGIFIDGFFIDGWLYFHFNFFVTTVPKTIIVNGIEENKDETKVPDLRDNEMLITSYFLKSRKNQTISMIAASRRLAKTTMNSSRLHRAIILCKEQVLCAGGSATDLGHISGNITTSRLNINPAFRVYYLSPTKDKRGEVFGIKTKDNKSIGTSNLFIINLEGGTKKGKKESLAGFTPDEFVLDEAMKFKFRNQLDALKPALWGSGILRCSVLITGTGGDDALAKDAIDMLNNPEGNDVTEMDWDELEKHVPEIYRTWKRRHFGLFLPTQMCIKHVKIKTDLATYLGIDSEELSKVPIFVTDWEKAKNTEEKERKAIIHDREKYVRLLAYHPFDPGEIFLSGKISPFTPVLDIAKQHYDSLMESGKWDNRYNLRRGENNEIIAEKVNNIDFIPFPFQGSNQDAPYNIIEHPDNKNNPKWYYVASGDFYKQETSTNTDSVGTIYIVKYPLLGDRSGKKIVASYCARPNRYRDFNNKVLLLLEYYNASLFPENEDLAVFQTFLEERKLEHEFLVPHLDFSGTLEFSTNSVRKWGWTAKQSKRRLMGIFINYLEEEVEILDEYDNTKVVKRIETVDDVYLLLEILNFTDNGNFDRISGVIGCFGLIHYLEKNYIYPKTITFKKKEEQTTSYSRHTGIYTPLRHNNSKASSIRSRQFKRKT